MIYLCTRPIQTTDWRPFGLFGSISWISKCQSRFLTTIFLLYEQDNWDDCNNYNYQLYEWTISELDLQLHSSVSMTAYSQ